MWIPVYPSLRFSKCFKFKHFTSLGLSPILSLCEHTYIHTIFENKFQMWNPFTSNTSVCLSWTIASSVNINLMLLIFLKDFVYFFLQRGERREEKRERNIIIWLPLVCPHLGTWSVTQACALMGNRTSNLPVHKLVLNPLSHTSQGLCYWFDELFELFKILFKLVKLKSI